MKHPFSAVLFDLDGTLIDSLYDIAHAMNHTLERFGYPVYPLEDYNYFVGNGLKNLVQKCLPEDKKEKIYVEETLAAMMEEYEQSCIHKTVLYDGIPELLDALTANHYKLAVLSNKADPLTQKIAKQLLSRWKFEIILGANDNFPRKPVPDAALFIANTMQIAPENILYLGDTNIDMQTAHAAGMYPVGVSWGFRPKKELEENGAKFIIDYPTDLLKK
ncbi:phosphoglycolate phosphatase [Bacteroidia bacterium]|nr:phosphoglycolate phosphatase [Bacteroidia bacterium]GHT02454.1 phosphoglycolate phosphatase [Bacteroidia bacterium]GHT49723.1 phosphoglycolate phosphatase [Bacteroidia bacterium]